MRVADVIAHFVYDQGVDTVFLVTGGGAMFLDDGLACHDKLRKVYCHHEQAAAMAAVGYAKYKGLGCACVTTGCGGTNTITGVLDAWQDSAACLFISGQVKRAQTIRNSGLALRQFGPQEADIVALVTPITKYAVMVNDPNQILYHLEKALHLAKSGRPGPVWLDIPLDVQSAEVDAATLVHFTEAPPEPRPTPEEYAFIIDRLKAAKRPVIIAGQGVRLAGVNDELRALAHRHQIPVVTAYLGIGTLPTTDPLYAGVVGIRGTRAGNYAVQNADVLLVLGSRLSIGVTGHEYALFAPRAYKIVVDIDSIEHSKGTVKIDRLVVSHLKAFFQDMPEFERPTDPDWPARCLDWKQKYPVCLPEYADETGGVNMNYFIKTLSGELDACDAVVSDAGSTTHVTAQTLELTQPGQRYISAGAQGEMGYALPAAVGISAAKNGRCICVTGDGSLQMNVQELSTVFHNRLPVKVFVWNNGGYLSIRATQRRYFEGRLMGVDAEHGVSFPPLDKLAGCFGIPYARIDSAQGLSAAIRSVLKIEGPVLCEVVCQRDQDICPKVISWVNEEGRLVSSPLDNMYPFLPDEEHAENMRASREAGDCNGNI